MKEAAGSSDSDFRLRLEGRAERLDRAQVRLLALAQMLRGLRWRSRLRANTALLRETAAEQGAVEEALAVVERRGRSESWPLDVSVMRTARWVDSLSNQVALLALKRLGPQAKPEGLSDRLERLELRVLSEPRIILPGQRWRTALQVLPLTHRDVRLAGQFGQLLEKLFKRPLQPSHRLPFTLAELGMLAAAWPQGQQALRAVWTRVGKVDAAGSLAAFLRHRAAHPPVQPPRNGVEWVLTAEFWRNFALGRLREITQATVAPLSCSDAELLEVLRWLAHREADITARLPASEVLSDSRAGLLELAVELSALPPTPTAADSHRDGWWKRLAMRAQRAESAAGRPDYQKLQDNLQLFFQVLKRPNRRPPVYRALDTLPHPRLTHATEPTTLVEWVEALREKL